MAHFGFRKEDGSWFIGMNNKGQFYSTTNPYHPYIVRGNLVDIQKLYYLDFPVKKQVNALLVDYVVTPIEKLVDDRRSWIVSQASMKRAPEVEELAKTVKEGLETVIEKEQCLQE